MKGISIVVAFVLLCAFQTGVKEKVDPVFYKYKGAGKTISKISNLMISQSPGFQFGFQSYANHEVVSSTSFYNQPSDILHYILTTKENRTLHFQIPVLRVQSINIFDLRGEGNLRMEVVCSSETGVKVKEHNQAGGIVYSLKFTTYQIPLPVGTDMKMLRKRCKQLLKKVNKFNE